MYIGYVNPVSSYNDFRSDTTTTSTLLPVLRVVEVVIAVIIEDNILVYSINHYILYLCYLHPNINIFVIIFRNVSPSLSSCGQCSYKCVKLSVLYK